MNKFEVNSYHQDMNMNKSLADESHKNDNPRLSPPGIHFTKREAECFYLLSRVTTIKKVASILDLSPRTIEMYIGKIKNKMGLLYKSQLIEKAIELANSNWD